MDIDGEPHFHGIRLFIGQGLHADDRFSFAGDFHSPIDPLFPSRVDRDLLCEAAERRQTVAIHFEDHFDRFGGFEIVMHVRRQDDFVFLDKEPWRLQTHEKILLRHDLGFPLPDFRAVPQGPGLHFPAREVLGHVEGDFGESLFVGEDRRGPVGGVGEVLPHGRLEHCRAGIGAEFSLRSRFIKSAVTFRFVRGGIFRCFWHFAGRTSGCGGGRGHAPHSGHPCHPFPSVTDRG